MAFGVVVRSKQAENEGVGVGCTVTGYVELVEQPVRFLVAVRATMKLPDTVQSMVMEEVPCPTITPLAGGMIDQAKVHAGSAWVW